MFSRKSLSLIVLSSLFLGSATPVLAESCNKTVQVSEASASQSTQTIVDIASSSDAFETLVAAVKAADLVEALSGEGPFTVFAPTDEAFSALPEGTLETLLKPENKETLAKILTYHVVPGSVTSDKVSSGSVPTVEGQSVDISVDKSSGSVKVNGANVVKTDIEASNGVIHVIDAVILPPEM